MTKINTPAIWLIILIVGLPQLSETIYTPALPDIATFLHTSSSLVEFTLTIYLFGFSLGTLFWGRVSDKHGRKPCVLLGLVVFCIGSLICYASPNIQTLLAGRLIQAFGGSIGSVLGQAISRDSFQGPRLGQVYSIIGSSIGLFPIIGPIVGGMITQHLIWQYVFLLLISMALIVTLFIAWKLPETHHKENRNQHSLLKVLSTLMRDKRVIGFAFIVGAANGIYFSYFSEGSFYLIDILHLTPVQYGLSFMLIGGAALGGGLLSKYLNHHHPSQLILNWSIRSMIAGTALMCIAASFFEMHFMTGKTLAYATILCEMIMMFSFTLMMSNALALALIDYSWCVGTASSLFGFSYYCLVSLFTLGIALFHNGTVIPMPFYFLGLSLVIFMVNRNWVTKKAHALQTDTQ